MGICASCLGLGRRASADNTNESDPLLRDQLDAQHQYGSTAALSARAGLDHLHRQGATNSPPHKRRRDPVLERRERDAQELICAEANSRFIDVSWLPVQGNLAGGDVNPLAQQESLSSTRGSMDESNARVQTLFAPDYVMRFRETFGFVPALANDQAGRAMDLRPDWLTHLVHNKEVPRETWHPDHVDVPQEISGRLTMTPDDFLEEGNAPSELISPAA